MSADGARATREVEQEPTIGAAREVIAAGLAVDDVEVVRGSERLEQARELRRERDRRQRPRLGVPQERPPIPAITW